MLDEMAIKKHITWDDFKFCGYVDIGSGIDDDTTPVAKDTLVFITVCINATWKVPCAYFFIDGLSGTEQANLAKLCIQWLPDFGVTVASVTYDGPSCHLSMLSGLGASLNPESLVPSFSHPSIDGKKVHVLLDVYHMLKLVRNAAAEGGILVDSDGKKFSGST